VTRRLVFVESFVLGLFAAACLALVGNLRPGWFRQMVDTARRHSVGLDARRLP